MTDSEFNKITHEDLIKIPLKTLLAFQETLRKAIETRKETERLEIYEKIQTLASESGFSLSELFSDKAPKKATSHAKIKYRNPSNKDETWSGKGRKPNWLVALLDAGKNLEDFAV